MLKNFTAHHQGSAITCTDLDLPRLLAGVAFGRHSPGISRLALVHIGMRQDNDTVVRVLGDHLVSPRQHFVARFAFKSNNQEAHPCCLEVVP